VDCDVSQTKATLRLMYVAGSDGKCHQACWPDYVMGGQVRNLPSHPASATLSPNQVASRPHPGLFWPSFGAVKPHEPSIQDPWWRRRASHARVDEGQEAQLPFLDAAAALGSVWRPTTQFMRHTDATATRVEQSNSPGKLCIIANDLDVKPLWQVF
jgi:hypothetical protein